MSDELSRGGYESNDLATRSYVDAAVAGAGGGAAAPPSLRLMVDFGTGGSIARWVLGPIITTTVTYSPYGNAAEGTGDVGLIYSPDGGDVSILFDYNAASAVTCNARKRAADGTWSRIEQVTLPSGSQRVLVTETLGAGEWLGIHMETSGVTYTSFRAYW